MAFSFVVEDGTIVTGANSYVAVQEASDYLIANQFAYALWSALASTDQQHLLAWATRYIDQRATWNGVTSASYLASPDTINLVQGFVSYPSSVTIPHQPLRWPRANVYDVDGNPIAYNVIPPQLKQATCEMARYLISSDRSLERPQDGLKEMKIDVMTLIFRENYILPIVPNEIAFILRGLGQIGSGTTGFGKVRRS